MGRRPTPQQVEWQTAARERFVLVLERLFAGNQTRLARALGVTQAFVSIVVRGVQPPTRNLMARVGVVERVNPHWAATGEGEPLRPDTRGTLPVSDMLLPGGLADHSALLTGERYAVASEHERATCYFWRLPPDHYAATVAPWRLRRGDLILLDTDPAVIVNLLAAGGRMCVLAGWCLQSATPVYGAVETAPSGRRTFSDGRPRLRLDDPIPAFVHGPPAPPAAHTPPPEGRRRRTIRRLDEQERRAAERAAAIAADPWLGLLPFDPTAVLAVQLLMVRL